MIHLQAPTIIHESSTVANYRRSRQVAKSIHGFTLIELLMVIAIIGILTSVALPYYEGYAVTARLSEVENAMTFLKSAVSLYRQEREYYWPDCQNIDEVRSSLGVGLANIRRIAGVSVSNGVIMVTIQNISPLVDGKWLSLTPNSSADGSISWTWGWSPDFPPHMRPKT